MNYLRVTLVVVLSLLLCLGVVIASVWDRIINNFMPNKRFQKVMSDQIIKSLGTRNHEDYEYFNSTLDKILIVRPPGSTGHDEVLKFIDSELRSLNFHIELDHFKSKTPLGVKDFTNIIGTRHPNACKRLVVACHYDSKYFERGQFVGATDSAVPCAMMLQLAKRLDKYLDSGQTKELTLQLIFFDGEEAFRTWTETDSLYGSRHLANKWNLQKSQADDRCAAEHELDRIDLFVLLDLIGARNMKFVNYYSGTRNHYQKMQNIEKQLNQQNLMDGSRTSYFTNNNGWGVEDDNVPFERRNVPILHLIASPFPDVWHKFTDDRNHLDYRVINNANKIVELFVVDYLKLKVEPTY